jgi:hypothetical protein
MSRHEVQQESFARLSTQALMARPCPKAQRRDARPLGSRGHARTHARTLTLFACARLSSHLSRSLPLALVRTQQNARMWLAQFSAQPLPDEADVSFSRLIANGTLLSRVAASLLKATQQGLSVVPAVPMRVGEAWEAPAGASRAGRAADDAAAFVASCRAMGVRSVECCSAADVTNPGAASTKAVRAAPRAASAAWRRRASVVGTCRALCVPACFAF